MCTICLVNKKESTLCRLFCLQNKKFENRVGNIDGYLGDWSTIDFARYSGRPDMCFVRKDTGDKHEI